MPTRARVHGIITHAVSQANLTAILTLGPEEIEPYSGLDRGDTSCIKQDCTFCVKDGAANQKFFTETCVCVAVVGQAPVLTRLCCGARSADRVVNRCSHVCTANAPRAELDGQSQHTARLNSRDA